MRFWAWLDSLTPPSAINSLEYVLIVLSFRFEEFRLALAEFDICGLKRKAFRPSFSWNWENIEHISQSDFSQGHRGLLRENPISQCQEIQSKYENSENIIAICAYITKYCFQAEISLLIQIGLSKAR